MPGVFHTGIFINAKIIAAELNPQNPEAVAFKAGRIMLEQVREALAAKQAFAIETTLATRSYLNLVSQAQLLLYEVVLFFFYLPSAQMTKERVKLRVSKGDTIFRRTSLKEGAQQESKTSYILKVDRWCIYKNDQSPPEFIAEAEKDSVAKNYNLNYGKTKKKVELSQKHREESEAVAKALQKISEKLIAETKEKNSYLVVSDEEGNIKKIPAKDL